MGHPNRPRIHQIDEVLLWVADGAIHVRIENPFSDPTELSGDEARRLAGLLLDLAEEADRS